MIRISFRFKFCNLSFHGMVCACVCVEASQFNIVNYSRIHFGSFNFATVAFGGKKSVDIPMHRTEKQRGRKWEWIYSGDDSQRQQRRQIFGEISKTFLTTVIILNYFIFHQKFLLLSSQRKRESKRAKVESKEWCVYFVFYTWFQNAK